VIVEHIGWVPFFFVCTGLAVPGMLLLFWVAPWSQSISAPAPAPAPEPLAVAKNPDPNS
jgi:PAT family beta-lactamase induction signal transducer AmpG